MSILEIARQAYEDIEAYEKAIGQQLDKKPRTSKQHVEQQHAISNLLEEIQAQSATVATQVLADEDNSFKEELAGMKGQNAFGAFYAALKGTKEYHAKYPHAAMTSPNEATSEAMHAITSVKVEFSGEEVHGKFVDLVMLHERALNLKACFPEAPDYSTYVSTFASSLERVPLNAKMSGAYAAYVRDLTAYLASFFQRTQPLVDVPNVMAKECEAPFESAWEAGQVKGWEMHCEASKANGGDASSASSANNTAKKSKPVDLSNCHCPEDVMALGLARVKEGLEALGLKMGGSLHERAQRLYSTKGVPREQWPKKIFAPVKKNKENNNKEDAAAAANGSGNGDNKADEGKAGGGGGDEGDGGAPSKKRKDRTTAMGSEEAKKFEVARNEACVQWLSVQLEEPIQATLKFLERKHTISLEELRAELAEEEEEAAGEDGGNGAASDDDDEDGNNDDAPLYNPLNLPLGWDGKPIPYWLYKLHGLGIEYKCEICGNASYFGRRAFDKHFQEWRHAYGMRCLGIPNTKHFHDITIIEDAIALNAKLQEGIEVESFDPSVAEEYEDSEGHVLNRKTYEDLARQGLL